MEKRDLEERCRKGEDWWPGLVSPATCVHKWQTIHNKSYQCTSFLKITTQIWKTRGERCFRWPVKCPGMLDRLSSNMRTPCSPIWNANFGLIFFAHSHHWPAPLLVTPSFFLMKILKVEIPQRNKTNLQIHAGKEVFSPWRGRESSWGIPRAWSFSVINLSSKA